MPIVDSKTGQVRKAYTAAELIQAANMMRGYNLIALCAAGSGHAGGTMSIMDITAALYLQVARHDPQNPFWEDRDRIIWSTGHKAPSLYLGLGMAGYFPVEDVVRLRKLYAPYQGHPHWLKLPGVEISSGSLGQGFRWRSELHSPPGSTGRITGFTVSPAMASTRRVRSGRR